MNKSRHFCPVFEWSASPDRFIQPFDFQSGFGMAKTRWLTI
jgi:hypothetical protein